MRAHSPSVVDALSSQVRSAGVLLGLVAAEAYVPAAGIYVGPPPSPLAANPEESGCGILVPRAHVLAVLSHGNVPEISYSVVAPAPVDVVYHTCRPRPCRVEPREAVGEIAASVRPNIDVPVAFYGPCNFASSPVGNSYTPSEHPSLWIIIKKFAQTLCGELSFAHDAVLLRQLVGSGTPWLVPRRTAPL